MGSSSMPSLVDESGLPTDLAIHPHDMMPTEVSADAVLSVTHAKVIFIYFFLPVLCLRFVQGQRAMNPAVSSKAA